MSLSVSPYLLWCSSLAKLVAFHCPFSSIPSLLWTGEFKTEQSVPDVSSQALSRLIFSECWKHISYGGLAHMRKSMFMCQCCLLGNSKTLLKSCYCMHGVCVHSFIWRHCLMILVRTQNTWKKKTPQLEKKGLFVQETIFWIRIEVRKQNSVEAFRSLALTNHSNF